MATSVTPVEALRAQAVLEDAILKLSFLSSLTPDILSHQEEVSGLIGEEMKHRLATQRALEQKYDILIEQRAQLKGLANKSKFKEVQAEIVATGEALRESLKNLTRSLKDNPNIGENLGRVAEEREAMQLLLERTLMDLRDGHFNSLSEFVRRETEQREKLSLVSSREEETAAAVNSLAATLKEEEDKHAQEVEMKRAEIGILKDKLRKMKVDTSLTLRYARKEVAARNEATGRQYTVEEAALAKEIEEIKIKIAQENVAHEASMEILTKEQQDFAKSAQQWKDKHVADLASKQAELEAAIAARDAQRAELQALQDRYENDLREMVMKQEESDKKKQEILYAIEEEQRKKTAATQLQKIIGDMFLTVKAVADAAAEAKKGAKGKGGAKKK